MTSFSVKSDELERIKLAFKRASGNSNLMPKNSFIHDLIGEVVAKRLAEVQFFQVSFHNYMLIKLHFI